MERQPHINPWAEKLSQVSMPDGGEAWTAMEAILEKEMPQRRDWRRWFLLILLLLLLIGVCNCPGRLHLRVSRGTVQMRAGNTGHDQTAGYRGDGATAGHNGDEPTAGHTADEPTSGHPLDEPAPGRRVHRVTAFDDTARYVDTARYIAGKTRITTTSPRKRPTTSPEKRPTIYPGKRPPGKRPTIVPRINTSTPTQRSVSSNNNEKTSAGKHVGKKRFRGTGDHDKTSAETQEDENPGTPENGKMGTPVAVPQQKKPTLSQPPAQKEKPIPSVQKKKPTAPPQPPAQKKKTTPPPQPPDQREKEHGWMIGVGLNQFFPIDGQKGSTYSSDGLTGTLSDYLPVPMIRYYFNHRLYIQLEGQLNTPQPIKKDLVFNSPLPDTSTIRNTTIVSSASIQRLYYFNIPLSLHYALSDRLNVGTGLQFSHLSNAIGNFDSTITNRNTSIVTDTKATKSFKNDTLFHRMRTNELRFLLDVNYTYKHFVLGLRYNQALSKFIDLQLPTGGATAARNSSLQLYLRYILLDTRKKKTPK